jgi:hypothetical protein
MALTRTHNRMIADAAVNVKDFGAVGDGVTDDEPAFTAALAASNAVIIPEPSSYYKLGDTVTVGHKQSLIGIGNFERIELRGSDKTKAVIRLEGQQYTGNFTVRHESSLTASDTGAIGIELSSLRKSYLLPLQVVNAYHGMHIDQADGALETGANTMFQNTFSYLDLSKCYGRHLNLDTYNSGSTGNAFLNVRTSNYDTATTKLETDKSIFLSAFTENHFGQVNIEHGDYTSHPLSMSGCGVQHISSLHYEGVKITASNTAFIQNSKGSLNISAVDIRLCTIDTSITAFLTEIFAATNKSTSIIIGALNEEQTTVNSGGAFRLVRYTASQASDSFLQVNYAEIDEITNAITDSSSAMARIVKRFGELTSRSATYYGSDIKFQGDADLTIKPKNDGKYIYNVDFTAARTLNLPTTNIVAGDEYIIRRADAGGFNLTVTDGTLSFTLAAGANATVKYSGTAWIKVQ